MEIIYFLAVIVLMGLVWNKMYKRKVKKDLSFYSKSRETAMVDGINIGSYAIFGSGKLLNFFDHLRMNHPDRDKLPYKKSFKVLHFSQEWIIRNIESIFPIYGPFIALVNDNKNKYCFIAVSGHRIGFEQKLGYEEMTFSDVHYYKNLSDKDFLIIIPMK